MITIHSSPQLIKISATKLLIDNEWVYSSSGQTFATINPATESVICEVAAADSNDIDLAVAAARRAFERGEWAKRSGQNWIEIDLSDRYLFAWEGDKQTFSTIVSTGKCYPLPKRDRPFKLLLFW